MIPELLHKKLYGYTRNSIRKPNVCTQHIINQLKKSIGSVKLDTASINGNLDYPWTNVAKYLPPLKNDNVIDHLNVLGQSYSSPYLKCANDLIYISNRLLENRPSTWSFQKGWTRYTLNGNHYVSEPVKYPLEDAIVFDIEVCLEEKNNNKPTLAVALTPEAWYSWCGESLFNIAHESHEAFNFIDEVTMDHLIPMGHCHDRKRLIVGHNVSFDRSYIKEQYLIELDETRFLDTMSLHICVSGLNQDQKMFAIRNGNPWKTVSSLNNLNDVYKLYCNSEENIDKDPRDIFVKGTMKDVFDNFQHLTNYCANDVAVTLKILKSIFPTFVERFPNPVTFVGMLEMSVMYLPVNKKTWKRYLTESQSIYEEYKGEINQTLVGIASDSCNYMKNRQYAKDPWLWDLDWSTRNIGFKKSFELMKRSENKSLVEILIDTSKHLKKSQSPLSGYPKWFLEFSEGSKQMNKLKQIDLESLLESNQLSISPRLRSIPKLLKLMWNGFPLFYDKVHGWGYLVPDLLQENELVDQFKPLEQMRLLMNNNEEEMSKLKWENGFKDAVPGCLFFKLPHKDGPSKRVGNPLGKVCRNNQINQQIVYIFFEIGLYQ